MSALSAERTLRSYIGPALKSLVVLCLLVGSALTIATSRLNGFERYLDTAILWIYLQIPLLVVGVGAGCLSGISHMLWDWRRGSRSMSSTRLIFSVAAGTSGIVMFFLLSWTRANWWYVYVHPWIETWGQSFVVFVLSLLGILLFGIIAYLLVWKILSNIPAIARPSGRFGFFRIAVLVLVVTHLLFLLSTVVFRGRQPVAAEDAVVTLPRNLSAAPVILVGLDGATWRVIEPLLERGALPNVQALLERGAYGPLETLAPCNSPILWTSVATGVRRERHGVMNFMIQHPRGMSEPVRTFPSHVGLNTALMLRNIYGPQVVRTYPVTAEFRRAATVWEIAGAVGVEVGAVNWWPSWPAGEVNGFIVSNRLDEFVKLRLGESHSVNELEVTETEGLTSPIDLLSEIAASVKRHGWDRLGDEEWVRLTLELYEERQPQLLLAYLPGPDGPQHNKWHAYEPQYFRSVEPEFVAQHQDDIPAVYRRFDRLLGLILNTMSEDTTLLIVSDHGASPIFDLGPLRNWKAGHEHSPPGIVIAAGPGIRNTGRFQGASILDITPTILTLLGIPVAESMEGNVLTDILTPEVLAHASPSIETWDFLVTETGTGSESRLTEEAEKALKALGYIN